MNNKYEYNTNVFKRENLNKDSAYMLGFIMADGCIIKSKKSYTLSIMLKHTDANILEFFKTKICPEKQIDIFNKTNKTTKNTVRVASLRLYSKEICEDLKQYGIIPRKTGKEIIPDLPDELMPHFIRGYFDGDGSVSKHVKQKRLHSNISCANKDFLTEIKNMLRLGGAISENGNCFKLSLNINDIFKFREYIYGDGGFSLKRKKDLFFSNWCRPQVKFLWSEKDEEKVLDLKSKGFSYKEIGKKLKRTYNATRRKCLKLKNK